MSTQKKRKVPLLGLPMAPDTHLLETKLFRLAVGAPLLLGLLFYLVALGSSWSELTLCGRAECFTSFFSLFKFQIGVMGIAIPLGALVASQHRSVQTKEQIDSQWKQINAQEKQNIFSNHLSHRNHFNEFFEEFKPFEDANTFSKWDIYESLFPDAPDGIFAANRETVMLLDEIDELTERLNTLIKADELRLKPDMKMRLIGFHANAESLLGLSAKTLADKEVDMPANEMQKHLIVLKKIALGLHSCLNFHKTHIKNNAVQKIIQKINRLEENLETECRCERIANTILKCLIDRTYGVNTTADNQSIVERTFRIELEKIKGSYLEDELDFDVLEQEARIVLDNHIPEKNREEAKELLPRLLRMVIS